jgi:tRNA(Ile)-lysidine synthase
VSAAERTAPLSAVEADALFAGLADRPALVLAVSGGPDSTALLVLAARWRARLGNGPKMLAVTIDHGLRKESAKEAADVGRLAKKLGIAHRIVRWSGRKPQTGLQEAARLARYGLLAQEALRLKARLIVTAHTLDDQAETILFRLARGSGLTGLGAMTAVSPVPGDHGLEAVLLRPFLGVPKARLIATLRKEKIAFADDPSNRDPRFTRPRLRALMPALEREGLTAARLGILSQRLRRADAAIEAVVVRAMHAVSLSPWGEGRRLEFDAAKLFNLPAEIVLRLVGRAIAHAGDEGPVKLGKLESLCDAILGCRPGQGLRRTLAGALVTFGRGKLVIERAPARRPRDRRNSALTKRKTAASAGTRRL